MAQSSNDIGNLPIHHTQSPQFDQVSLDASAAKVADVSYTNALHPVQQQKVSHQAVFELASLFNFKCIFE